jgi:hypothetical protein
MIMAVLKIKDPTTGKIVIINTSGVNESYVNTKIATKAPKYLYGEEDMVAGKSELGNGILYFCAPGTVAPPEPE